MLYCQDLNSYLLENIYFEKAVSFASLRLGDIIRIIMNCSGFSEFYTDLIAINDAANDFINNEAYKQRLATNAAVNQDLLLATPFDRIKDKLDIFLPKLCKVGQQVVFRWEPGVYSVNANGANRFLNGFVFDNRYALHNRDVAFKFTGISKNSIDNQLTITSRPELNDDLGWHGLIVDNFTISVNTKPLAFRVETAGFNLIDGLFVENTDNDVDFDSLSRISPLKLNQIVDSLVKTSDPVPTKYIGFRKQVKDYYDRTEFPSSSIMRFKHQQNTQVVSKPFHSIGFDCYVTQPLKFWGTFYINYFDGSDPQNNIVESPVTETYVYSRLTYVINKSSNLITASVQGIRIPWTIRGLEELSS